MSDINLLGELRTHPFNEHCGCFRCQAEWKRRDELGLWPRGALDGRDSSDYEPGELKQQRRSAPPLPQRDRGTEVK